jgi:predicted NUDIX family NTP pyrophosphohydrolase
LGAWTIPKGQCQEGEDLLATAIREFCEETSLGPNGPFLPLGFVKQKAGKTVHAWAFEGDAEVRTLRSNMTEIEWPPGSRRKVACPEIDRYAWFEIPRAEQLINAAQVEFLRRLTAELALER